MCVLIDVIRGARELAEKLADGRTTTAEVVRAIEQSGAGMALTVSIYRCLETIKPVAASRFASVVVAAYEERGDAASTARGESDAEKLEAVLAALETITQLAADLDPDSVRQNLLYAKGTAKAAIARAEGRAL